MFIRYHPSCRIQFLTSRTVLLIIHHYSKNYLLIENSRKLMNNSAIFSYFLQIIQKSCSSHSSCVGGSFIML
jgi:hypothetical protein